MMCQIPILCTDANGKIGKTKQFAVDKLSSISESSALSTLSGLDLPF